MTSSGHIKLVTDDVIGPYPTNTGFGLAPCTALGSSPGGCNQSLFFQSRTMDEMHCPRSEIGDRNNAPLPERGWRIQGMPWSDPFISRAPE